jgi:DNA helicase HerA-like ATPase
VIGELAVGEALVSCLDRHGTPAIVERAWILPPASRIGPINAAERQAAIDGSLVRGHYETAVDRESAYETLAKRASADAATDVPSGARDAARPSSASRPSSGAGSLAEVLFGSTGPRGGKREGILESAARSAARSVGSGMGRQLLRGLLGSLTGRR